MKPLTMCVGTWPTRGVSGMIPQETFNFRLWDHFWCIFRQIFDPEFSPGLFSMVLRHATCLEFYLITLKRNWIQKKRKKNRKETLYYYNNLNLHSLLSLWCEMQVKTFRLVGTIINTKLFVLQRSHFVTIQSHDD